MTRLEQLRAWNPEEGDLSDELAAAIDQDPELRAAFDARFVPAVLEPVEAPRALGLPRTTGRAWGRGLVAAAALVVAVGVPTYAVLEENSVLRAEVEGERAPDRAARERWPVETPPSASAVPPRELESTAPDRTIIIIRGASAAAAPAPAEESDAVVSVADVDGDAPVEKDVMRELVSLGYVEDPTPDPSVASGSDANHANDVGTVLTADFLRRIPGGRSYQEAVSVSPRVTAGERPNVVNTETYTHPGVHGRTITADDPVSTFAADVDTGSWTIVRRKLREGYLPPAAAVRTEEALNWFTYSDPSPPASRPFEVVTEAVVTPWDPNTRLVRVGVQGRRPSGSRPPVHLTFLVDTSGSMQSADKIDMVQAGLRMLVEQLSDGDTVAIVVYAGSAGVVLQPTGIEGRSQILRAIEDLRAGGSTAMGAGIQAAYTLAESRLRQSGTHRVILLSDGDANVGATTHGPLVESIRYYAKQGIALTTVGVGDGNYRDTMMERLADEGDGQYVYLDSQDEAQRVFVERFAATAEVLARDVKIQVDWDPSAVSWYRLLGYENRAIADRDFRNDAVDAGEIGLGHHVTAVYEVSLTGPGAPSLGTVRLRWKAPGADAPASEHAWPMSVSHPAPSLANAPRGIRLAVTVAAFTEKLRGGPLAERIAWQDLRAWSSSLAAQGGKETAELAELVTRAADLSR